VVAAGCSGDFPPPSPPAEKATDSHEDRPQLSVAVRALRPRTLHRTENISSVLKRGMNVCQRQFVNEVLALLVTEFVRNFGGEGATPIQRGSNASLLGRVQAVKFIRH
jgi:hypothetical protein